MKVPLLAVVRATYLECVSTRFTVFSLIDPLFLCVYIYYSLFEIIWVLPAGLVNDVRKDQQHILEFINTGKIRELKKYVSHLNTVYYNVICSQWRLSSTDLNFNMCEVLFYTFQRCRAREILRDAILAGRSGTSVHFVIICSSECVVPRYLRHARHITHFTTLGETALAHFSN